MLCNAITPGVVASAQKGDGFKLGVCGAQGPFLALNMALGGDGAISGQT
jgi:hypothetical protein